MSEGLSNNYEGGKEERNETYWANKALHKALLFIPNLDETLKVSVENHIIHPDEQEPHKGVVLHFSSEENPSIEWTMSIEQSEDYIENELEGVVKKIYAEKSKNEGSN